MDDVPEITLSHAIARLAIRLEAAEEALVVVAARLLARHPADAADILAEIEGFGGPAFSVVDGARYDTTPEHRDASAEAAGKLAARISERVHQALRR